MSEGQVIERRLERRIAMFVAAEILISMGVWCGAFLASYRSGWFWSFYAWSNMAVLSMTFGQLLMLATVTALWEFRRPVCWLLILMLLVIEAVLLSLLLIVLDPHFGMEQLQYILSWTGLIVFAQLFSFFLTIGITVVLFLHVLIWPVASVLKWQIHRSGESPRALKSQFRIWHLFAWTGLIASLLSISRTLVIYDSWKGITTFVVLWGVAAILAGFPTLILATRRTGLWVWWPAICAGLAVLTLLESELGFALTKAAGSGTSLPFWVLGICNFSVAASVILQVFALRGLGLAFKLDLAIS